MVSTNKLLHRIEMPEGMYLLTMMYLYTSISQNKIIIYTMYIVITATGVYEVIVFQIV